LDCVKESVVNKRISEKYHIPPAARRIFSKSPFLRGI